MTLTYNATQEEFDQAFGQLTLEQTIELILGEKKLTPEQQDLMRRAAGSSGVLRFDPDSVMHLTFRVVGGGGPTSGHHVFAPATPVCRTQVNRKRRERFNTNMGCDRATSDTIFSLCKGWDPALKMAVIAWPLLKNMPTMSNAALFREGLRPDASHCAAALRSIRVAIGIEDPSDEERQLLDVKSRDNKSAKAQTAARAAS